MDSYYGSIDLTKLGLLVRQHPELVKTANMKDGTQHKFLNIGIDPKRQTDQFGNCAYIKASCKKEQQKQGVNYYLCDLKLSRQQSAGQQPAAATGTQTAGDELPF